MPSLIVSRWIGGNRFHLCFCNKITPGTLIATPWYSLLGLPERKMSLLSRFTVWRGCEVTIPGLPPLQDPAIMRLVEARGYTLRI